MVFEGGQGLLLDEKNVEFFPHLTRSATGLRNVVPHCRAWGLDQLDVLYVTRTYMTRHGAGPFPTEAPAMQALQLVDTTNVRNEWQGALRYGTLDLPRVRAAIDADLQEALDDGDGMYFVRGVGVALNHADQYGGYDEDVARVRVALALPVVLMGLGPRREQTMVRDHEWLRCGAATKEMAR